MRTIPVAASSPMDLPFLSNWPSPWLSESGIEDSQQFNMEDRESSSFVDSLSIPSDVFRASPAISVADSRPSSYAQSSLRGIQEINNQAHDHADGSQSKALDPYPSVAISSWTQGTHHALDSTNFGDLALSETTPPSRRRRSTPSGSACSLPCEICGKLFLSKSARE